jgi:hypothetical protein
MHVIIFFQFFVFYFSNLLKKIEGNHRLNFKLFILERYVRKKMKQKSLSNILIIIYGIFKIFNIITQKN